VLNVTAARRVAGARVPVDLGPVRWLGAAMLTLGAVLPHVAPAPGLPCPLRTVTGMPCPLCGMSTSVEATCAGHLRQAVAANPVGLLAVAVAGVLLLRSGWRGVRLPVAPLALVAVVSWAWELHRFRWF
jgi:hypothetical protein